MKLPVDLLPGIIFSNPSMPLSPPMDHSGRFAIRAESDVHPLPAELPGAYIAVATMGMFLWDILTNLSSEYHFVLKRKIGWPALVYLWSRLNIRANTLAGLIGGTLFFAAPIGRFCSIFSKAILIGFPPFVASETLLLFFRVRAVYMGRKRVVTAFFISLLITVGCSTLIPFVGEGFQISPENRYCTARMNPALGEAMLIIPLLNHISVFFAISFRLMPAHIFEESSSKRGFLSKARVFFRGKHLPSLSKTLLVDGQRYILVFILTTIATVVAMAIGHLPDIYRFILVAPHVAIENSMNCYLFRSIRIKALTPDVQVTESTIHFHQTENSESATIRSTISQSV
ncbi:hypothetical protein WG66_004368 [Moniliophthora roreri]|nr:hypothetical protein WG66_004368 [Moniliophthora roreri]